ncbi:MAG: UDP-3-O-(3-hydroxymyristoyl)glucosamine N-acyltransferase [bacterium]
MKLKDLAKLVGGELAGSGETPIKNVAPVESAKPGDLVFVLEEKHLKTALDSKASAVVAPAQSAVSGKPAILVAKPRRALAKILTVFSKEKPKKGLHKTAVVPKSCSIGKNVYIGPYVVLGEKVSVGDQSIINAHVSIYDNTRIGKRVIIHSGARLGVDGFGYIQEDKKHIKIPQIGRVIIEDDVEIYANVCISRGTLGDTIIGTGTKIDNLSHIAHNCKIGKNCAIVSLVGIAGSVTLEDNVYVAGQAGFNGHIKIGHDAVVMARAGVTKDIPANALVSGFPAQDHKKEVALQATLRHLAKKAR